jgi:hypothetical protein
MEGPRRKALVAAAAAFWFLAFSLWCLDLGSRGLSLRISESDGRVARAYPHAALNTFRIDSLSAVSPRPLRAEWAGVWNVPSPGFSSLVLKADGPASLRLDGELILETALQGRGAQSGRAGAWRADFMVCT